MDSVKGPSTKPRYRGKGSVARRADAFRQRIAAKLPSQRDLMDAKFMGPEMSNSLALSDYLGKFYSHLSVQETKSLICLSVEDPSHSSLAKYWDEIAGRDSTLGDSSDDDMHNVVACTLVACAHSAKGTVAPSTTPTLSSEVINEPHLDAVHRHSSCVLTPEEGKVFEEYLLALDSNVESSPEVGLGSGAFDDVAVRRLDSDNASAMVYGHPARRRAVGSGLRRRRLRNWTNCSDWRHRGSEAIGNHQCHEASYDSIRIVDSSKPRDGDFNIKEKPSKEFSVLESPSSPGLGVIMAFLCICIGHILLLYAYHASIGMS